MKPRPRADRPVPQPAGRPWFPGVTALALLFGVGWLDWATGPDTKFTLLYLFPVAVSTYLRSRRNRFAICVCAAGAGFACALPGSTSLTAECWNAAGHLGEFLLFSTMLDHLRRHYPGRELARRTARLLALSTAAACVMAVVGWTVQQRWPEARGALRERLDTSPHITFADLAVKTESTLRTSRPVLLGSRDPTGPSCVTPVKAGEVVDKPLTTNGDLNGGPGTSMEMLYSFDRLGSTTAMRDFGWHQTRLKSFLENELLLNQSAAAPAHDLAQAAHAFLAQTESWSSVPEDVAAIGYSRRDNWPSYCLTELDQAIKDRSVTAAQHWAGELEAATFSLEDLHAWLALLCENHLAALAFQAQCRGLFEWADTQLEHYDPMETISAFPAGLLSLNGWGNYTEVERQAERLYSMPQDGQDAIAQTRNLTSGSLWVLPALRAPYLVLRSALSSDNQRTWDEAARTPYEHSYLISMLHRASSSNAVDSLASVLRHFDTVHPHATVGELMSVLMYRGHSFAGLEWSDRFQPELLAAATEIPTGASDETAFMAAYRWTYQFKSGSAYAKALTLRAALEEHKLDCVRATDMIGAIFRGAGRTGFGHVRWSAGTTGHSVAAHLWADNGKLKTSVADAFQPLDAPEVWPDSYFQGHQWPALMEGSPPPYAVELYLRGLDNYMFAEGYVIRGPNAGWLTKAGLPYAPVHKDASITKVYEGPYPN